MDVLIQKKVQSAKLNRPRYAGDGKENDGLARMTARRTKRPRPIQPETNRNTHQVTYRISDSGTDTNPHECEDQSKAYHGIHDTNEDVADCWSDPIGVQ